MENRYIGYVYPKDSEGNYVKVDTILNGMLYAAHDYPTKAVKINPKKVSEETPTVDDDLVSDDINDGVTVTENEEGTVNINLPDDGVTVTENEEGTVNINLPDDGVTVTENEEGTVNINIGNSDISI